MIFDMNRAWREATEMVNANREVMLIVAGLFFFLPGLAFSLFVPAPQPTAEMTPEQAMALVSGFYSDNALWLILMAILQTVGMLTLLVLLRDQAKPTVGDALKRAATGILPYLASLFLVALGLVLVLGLVVGLASATGVVALVVIALIAAGVVMVYAMVKVSLCPAIIAIERSNNPITVLTRSWALTKGNSFRLFLFYALLIVAIGVAALVVGGILGIVFAALGGTVQHIGQALVSGLIGSVATVYFVGLLASIHRQLAGPSAEAITRTFE